MGAESLAYSYIYPFESGLRREGGKTALRLATSGGGEAHPHFFAGTLRDPLAASALLLTVGRVAQSRFYTPPAMVQRLLREADPVVTCDGERLRFEAFSQCCGVYARADLLPEALSGDFVGRGTTNVDFNPPMRTALAQLAKDEAVALRVGADEVELAREGGSVIERKVKLPLRWLKGFVEVQAYARELALRHEIPGPEARRFLAGLSAQVSAKDRCFLVAGGRRLRLSQQGGAGAVEVGGIGRLKILVPLARSARSLRIYGGESGVSAWELDLAHSRFELTLSPQPARSFSGEGQVLRALANREGEAALARVRAALAWQACLSPGRLASEVGAEAEAIEGALAALGSQGLVGYDLGQSAYFHRRLPFDLAAVEALHPRLAKARAILEAGAVRLERRFGDRIEATVSGSDVAQRVVREAGESRCSCPWFSRNRGEAGPCAHILAVELALETEEQTE